MARICPACGRANDDDASYCQSCGIAVAGATPASGTSVRRGRDFVAVLVVAIAIAAVAVAALLVVPREDAPEAGGAAAAPAGATIAVSPAPALDDYLAGATGARADCFAAILADGTVLPITRFSGQQIRHIAYSPDGASLACVAGTPKRSDLWLFNAADGTARQVTASMPDVVAVDSVAWLSPTKLLLAGFAETPQGASQNADLLVCDIAARSFSPLKDARGVALRGVSVSASRDGEKVAYVNYTDVETGEGGGARTTERLRLLDRATGAVTELGKNQAELDARAFDQPLISPSGRAVIFRRSGSDAGTSYTVVGADGTTLMPAKKALFPAGYSWDPEGTKVVFTGHPVEPRAGSAVGPAVFWVFDLETGATREIARYKDALVQDLSWSPNGELIAWAGYSQEEPRAGTVYLMPARGGEPWPLVEDAFLPVWAPGAAPPLRTSPSP